LPAAADFTRRHDLLRQHEVCGAELTVAQADRLVHARVLRLPEIVALAQAARVEGQGSDVDALFVGRLGAGFGGDVNRLAAGLTLFHDCVLPLHQGLMK